jgi:hypothetical protein
MHKNDFQIQLEESDITQEEWEDKLFNILNMLINDNDIMYE